MLNCQCSNPHFNNHPIKNSKGMASIEMIPIIAVFMLLLNFTLGFFGVVHSGILTSIASRNYAFETFRNRSNLSYLRDSRISGITGQRDVFYLNGYRIHGNTRPSRAEDWLAPQKPIKFTDISGITDPVGSSSDHNRKTSQVADEGKASDIFGDKDGGVNPVWLKVLYGICLNSNCGN